uniref:VP5A n=1 Tax=Callinectes sapidus reovirus 2 TaxID=2789658 RepID=A0A8K1M858_9REOV|nr:VP5A [Callinectes sapidus reovirus 2]
MANVRGCFQNQCDLKGINHSVAVDRIEGGFRCTVIFCGNSVSGEGRRKKEAEAAAFNDALALLVSELGYSERQGCPHLTALVDNIGANLLPFAVFESELCTLSSDVATLYSILFNSITSGHFAEYAEFKRILKTRGYEAHQNGSGCINVWKRG